MDQRRAATDVGGSNDTSNMRSKEQQYTPDTAAVREVYYAAPGVQDWEAARAASFDRWIAAHDAEVLASVQPLTPEQIAGVLPDRVAIHRIICVQLGGPSTHDHQSCENAANAVHEAQQHAVLALFPQPTPVDPDDEFVAPYEMQEEQPTPSAEPSDLDDLEWCHLCGAVLDGTADDRRVHRHAFEGLRPPEDEEASAEPGDDPWATTTEYAYGALDAPDIIVPTGEDIDDLGTARYNAEEFWVDVLQRTVKRGPWQVVTAEADPSTIRDVTPPTATPDEGDHG